MAKPKQKAARLTEDQQQLLCQIADPIAEIEDTATLSSMDPKALFDAIQFHGIEPVSVRKLSKLNHLLNDNGQEFLKQAKKNQLIANALAMQLQYFSEQILRGSDDPGIDVVIVKGPVFSADLYDISSDRPYTDLDLLCDKSNVQAAGQLLTSLGFQQFKRTFFDRSQINEEQKWTLRENPNLLIEIHTDLVHYKKLRDKLSFSYEIHQFISAHADQTVLNFIVAVVHASAGHKFDRLCLLVDVLQAYRQLSDRQFENLERALQKIPLHLEVATCIKLIEELFAVRQTEAFLSEIGVKNRHQNSIISAKTIFSGYSDGAWIPRIKRHLFRYYQCHARR